MKHTCAPCSCCGRSNEFGEYVICPDDLCRAHGYCTHRDGMAFCEACDPDALECDACTDERIDDEDELAERHEARPSGEEKPPSAPPARPLLTDSTEED